MTKTELLKAMSKEANLTGKQSKRAYNAMVKTIHKTLANGEDIHLQGVATIKVVDVPQKISNLRHRSIIPPHRSVKFKPSVSIKNIVK